MLRKLNGFMRRRELNELCTQLPNAITLRNQDQIPFYREQLVMLNDTYDAIQSDIQEKLDQLKLTYVIELSFLNL